MTHHLPIPTEQLEQLILLADEARAHLAVVRACGSLADFAEKASHHQQELEKAEAEIRAWAQEVCGVKP